MKYAKCVIVGDKSVGKTALLVSYATILSFYEYSTATFNNYNARFTVDDTNVNLLICDTRGGSEFDKMRILSYQGTDIFIVVFSVVAPTSLENVIHKWVPEISYFCPTVPFLLVGTKKDVRKDAQNCDHITYEHGHLTAQNIKAIGYAENTFTDRNISNVIFEQVVRATVREKSQLGRRPRNKCIIL